jgi:hypothetical protein
VREVGIQEGAGILQLNETISIETNDDIDDENGTYEVLQARLEEIQVEEIQL